MNQFFDLNRWLLLTAKHWSENRRRYLLSVAAIAGLLIIWYILGLIVMPGSAAPPDVQASTYFTGLAIVGFFYASISFSELASGPRAMNFLAVPASHFEKMLVAFLYSLVIFFVVYTAVFYLVDILMVNIGNSLARNWLEDHGGNAAAFVPKKIVNVFVDSDYAAGKIKINPNYYFLLIYFSLQSAFVLGSVYFPKFSFIKTIISLTVICITIIFILYKLVEEGMPEGFYYNGLTSWTEGFSNSDTVRLVMLPRWISNTIHFLLQFSFIPLFWVVTYYRLKEKEI
jgi:hypothetical protein